MQPHWPRARPHCGRLNAIIKECFEALLTALPMLQRFSVASVEQDAYAVAISSYDNPKVVHFTSRKRMEPNVTVKDAGVAKES